jgi:hypothetical protein
MALQICILVRLKLNITQIEKINPKPIWTWWRNPAHGSLLSGSSVRHSILHTACFITLCECFLGTHPHWGLWRRIFFVRRSASKNALHDMSAAPSSPFTPKPNTSPLEWPIPSKTGGRSGSILGMRNQRSNSSVLWYVQNVSTFPNTFAIVSPLICVFWIQLTRTNAVFSRIALVSRFCADI